MEEEFFQKYTNSFDMSIDGIKLKYDHSYQVLENAIKIAYSLDLSDELISKVRVCSLFHDIGRFSQYEQFHTFRDALSVDHGDRGYEVLKENGFTDKVLLNCVKYHNKYSIPDNLDEESILICKIVRDADKLDILDKINNKCNSKNYKITEDIMTAFRNHKSLKNSGKTKVKGNALALLKQIAFVFDFNFKESLKILKDKNIINKKCDLICKNNPSKEIDEIRNICNNYIESRLNDGIRKKI